MRVFVMKLTHGDEELLQSGVAAFPDARELALPPYHCEIVIATKILPQEVAIAKEKACREAFLAHACSPVELEDSSWHFYKYSMPLLLDMIEDLLDPSDKEGPPDLPVVEEETPV